MKKILLIIIVFTILSTILLKLDLLDRETAKSLDSACMLMDEQPDSSLNILLSINPSDIKSEYLQAQYALYLTQAKHYNHINENSDSLISFAVDFYDANKSSNPIQRMLAHYYSGLINANARKYSDAITDLIKAGQLAESQNQYLWLGRAQSEIARIYNKMSAFSEAAAYDSLACQAFRTSGDTVSLQLQTLKLANSLNNAGRCAESLTLLTEVLSDATRQKDTASIRQAHGLMADSHLKLKNFSKAADCYYRYMELSPNKATPQQYRSYIDALWQSGRHETAVRLIDSAKIKYGIHAEIPFEILFETGNTKEAYLQLKKAFAETDSVLDEITRQNVCGSAVEFSRNDIDAMKLSYQNDLIKLTILIILIITGGIGAAAFVSHSRKIQKQKDEQIIALAEELESILNDRNHDSAKSEDVHVRTTASDGNEPRFSISRKHLDTIRLLCETYYESNQKESIKSKTAHNVEQEIKNFVNNPDFQTFLEYLADSENNCIINRFRRQMPGLSDKEYQIFICSSLRLPVPVILMFFDLNRNTLYTTRRRMRQKIAGSHPSDEREFLSYL